jgi:formyl-CoA transferase
MADSDMMTVDSPFTLTGEEKVPANRHPEHGEHSRDILLGAGYSESEVETLHKGGVIGGP